MPRRGIESELLGWIAGPRLGSGIFRIELENNNTFSGYESSESDCLDDFRFKQKCTSPYQGFSFQTYCLWAKSDFF